MERPPPLAKGEIQSEYPPAFTNGLLSSLLKVVSLSVGHAPDQQSSVEEQIHNYRSVTNPLSHGLKQDPIHGHPHIRCPRATPQSRGAPSLHPSPYILHDRFTLSQRKGDFSTTGDIYARITVPDFIPELRQQQMGEIITQTGLLNSFGPQQDEGRIDSPLDITTNLPPPNTASGEISLPHRTVILLNKFGSTGFWRDLMEALRVGHLALLSDGITANEKETVLLALGTLLSQKFKTTKSTEDLNAASKFLDEAIELSSNHPNTSHRLECLVSQAITLTTKFCQTKKDEDLNEAIMATSDAMQELLQSPSHKDWFLPLSTCSAILYGERFCKDPCLLDWIILLESCIHIIADEGSSEISETLRNPEDKHTTLKILGLQLSRFHVVIERLDHCRMPADVDVGTLSIVDATAGRVLNGFWEEYCKRIRKFHPAIALAKIVNEGILSLRFQINGPIPNPENFQHEVESFGVNRFRLHFHLQVKPTAKALEKYRSEFDAQEQAANNMRPSLTPDQLRKLSALSMKKFEDSEDLGDLKIAIYYSQAALDSTPPDSAESLIILVELVRLFRLQFVREPNGLTLNQVIHYSTVALGQQDLNNPHKFDVALDLASVVREAFILNVSSLQELDKAISVLETTIINGISADRDQFIIPAVLPFTLAMCLKTRYQNTGEPKNLDDCITMIKLAMTFPDYGKCNPEEKSVMLINYGLILRLQYRRTKNLGDLDRAIEVSKEGLQHISKPAERLSPLNNLVLIFNDRHDRTQGQDDLRQAIKYGREGLAIAKSVNVGVNGKLFLINLANALSLTGDPSDLDTAVSYGLEALECDPNRRDYQAGAIRNDLSAILTKRYEQRGNFEDLNLAVKYANEALEFIPSTHPLRGEFLLQLGARLSSQPPSEGQVQRCLDVYQDAWNCLSTLPARRIEAASYAAKLLLEVGRIGDAAQLLESALELMSELEVRWTQRVDRQNTASAPCLALPANAAMVALQIGNDPAHALLLLETGRGRMLGSLMDFRSDVAVSHEGLNSAEVVRTFNRLRMKADATTSESESRQLKEKMKTMIQDTRRKPGFENFMFPPTSSDYMKLAAGAPIVVVTTSELVDPGVALIVTASRIYSLPLVNLTHQEMTTRMHEMSEHTTPGRRNVSRNARMLALLEWLWDTIVEPILNDLGFKGTTVDSETPLPRIRWVGVGLLAKAPFHAAGKYLPNGTADAETATNCVISSYAPSLRALLYSTERKQNQYLARRRDANVLLVQMSTTEGATPLVNVEEEVRTLTRIASSASMQTATLDAPTTWGVLKNLPFYNLVHFACHGVSDPEDPSESHLILSDGRLTVQEIMRTHAAAPDVAFLSACSTAKGNDARLVDESIHIASAFLMIGFRQVVGTLWETPDRACMEISNRFYAKLFEEDEIQWNGTWKVAEALHYAVKEVRDLKPEQPLFWASFVAFGA